MVSESAVESQGTHVLVQVKSGTKGKRLRSVSVKLKCCRSRATSRYREGCSAITVDLYHDGGAHSTIPCTGKDGLISGCSTQRDGAGKSCCAETAFDLKFDSSMPRST